MKINLTSIPVNDQQKALVFYTEKLGFEKQHDVAMGEHRWLTLTSPEGEKGIELLLEPLGFPPAKDYYQALYEAGIPAMSFASANIEAEVAVLKGKGVEFRGDIQSMDNSKIALFEDTCGNIICLVQQTK